MASVLKRPLNMLQNPVYPVIYKAEPQFKDARKNNMVDAGRVMMEIEHHPDMTTWGVLVQSKDRNKQHQYGQSSHKTVVNKEFRPPLLDPLLDMLPLTRIPVKHKPIMPGMINPGNPEAYQAPNDGCDNVAKHVTNDVKGDQGWRMNMVMPYEKDLQVISSENYIGNLSNDVKGDQGWRVNKAMPYAQNISDQTSASHDLSKKNVNYISVSSGMSTNIAPKSGVEETPLGDAFFANKLATAVSAGHTTQLQTPIFASNFFETQHEEKLMPSVSSGFEYNKKIDGEVSIPNAILLNDDKLNPILQSRKSTTFTRDGETPFDRLELAQKTSQGALTSGRSASAKLDIDQTPFQFDKKLNERRVGYSSTSYQDIPFKKQSATDSAKKPTHERKLATGNYYGTMDTRVVPVKGIGATSDSFKKMNGAVKETGRMKNGVK